MFRGVGPAEAMVGRRVKRFWPDDAGKNKGVRFGPGVEGVGCTCWGRVSVPIGPIDTFKDKLSLLTNARHACIPPSFWQDPWFNAVITDYDPVLR
jgi:hypothetical protein